MSQITGGILADHKFTWKIDKFSSRSGSLYSPPFVAHGIPFSIKIHTRNVKDGKEYIGLYLGSEWHNWQNWRDTMKVRSGFAIKNQGSNENIKKLYPESSGTYSHGSCWGWREFETLENVRKALKDDTLVIEVMLEITQKPVNLIPKPPPTSKYFMSRHLSDVKIVVKGSLGRKVIIPAHAFVLRRSSNVFERIVLRDENGQLKCREIQVEYSERCMKYMLAFMYEKEKSFWMPAAKGDSNLRMELLEATNFYDLPAIYDETIKEIMLKDVDHDRVLDLLSVSDKYARNDFAFKKAIIMYIVGSIKDIIKGDKWKAWSRNPDNGPLTSEVLEAICLRKKERKV